MESRRPPAGAVSKDMRASTLLAFLAGLAAGLALGLPRRALEGPAPEIRDEAPALAVPAGDGVREDPEAAGAPPVGVRPGQGVVQVNCNRTDIAPGDVRVEGRTMLGEVAGAEPAGGIDVTLETTDGRHAVLSTTAVLNTTAVRATLLGATARPEPSGGSRRREAPAEIATRAARSSAGCPPAAGA